MNHNKFKLVPIFEIMILCMLVCCSTAPKTTNTDNASKSGSFETGRLQRSDTDSGESEVGKTPLTQKSVYAVWIDGAGFDSLMALGALQELEKQNIKPAKIVGTGFGCWIALSWAMNNSGSQAEWQSFKWKDWSLVESKGFIGKLGGDPFEKSRAEIRKHFLKKSFREYRVPVDCPFSPKSSPYKYQTAKFVETDLALATQLQIPFSQLNIDWKEKSAWHSGAWLGIPNKNELKEFEREITSALKEDEIWRGWIVLKTRSSDDLVLKHPYLDNIQSTRPSENISGDVETVFFDLRANSAPFVSPQLSSVLSPENRRMWLLEGRRQAPALMKELQAKIQQIQDSY